MVLEVVEVVDVVVVEEAIEVIAPGCAMERSSRKAVRSVVFSSAV